MAKLVPVNLSEKLARFSDHWNPRLVGRYNGNELRVVKLQGKFTWHAHAETDELFLVLSGELGIAFRNGECHLKTGEMMVVPKGVEHRPFAQDECHVLIMDREGEPNTGDSPSKFTRPTLEEI